MTLAIISGSGTFNTYIKCSCHRFRTSSSFPLTMSICFELSLHNVLVAWAILFAHSLLSFLRFACLIALWTFLFITILSSTFQLLFALIQLLTSFFLWPENVCCLFKKRFKTFPISVLNLTACFLRLNSSQLSVACSSFSSIKQLNRLSVQVRVHVSLCSYP